MKSIFKTFILSVLVFAQVHFAFAQTASILPLAKTTFNDQNGKPLTSGTVDFYIPSTTTRKTTWQDAAETVPNTNPVVLDGAGRGLILGSGSYRQVVKDRNGNLIWDQVTSSVGSGGGSSSTATGDGDLVGTIKPWAGLTAPNQYMFTNGQEVSRTTFSVLFTAITSSQSIFCNSGSPILSGLSDTTNFWIGMPVELSCVPTGFTTVSAKTNSTVTLAVSSNVTANVNAIFYPWGRGNGSTTFNLPDLRGFVIAGNNNMGGVASSRLTTAFYGATDPNSIGAAGGNQATNLTLLTANLPPYTPSGSIVNGAITINGSANTFNSGSSGSAGSGLPISSFASLTASQAGSTFTGIAQGGTSLPVTTSVIQPTKTANYIIKVTPDANSATASGVTSIQGMTGDIACGANLTCTGNIITVNIPSIVQLTVGATTITNDPTNDGVLYNNGGVLGSSQTLPSGLTIPSPSIDGATTIMSNSSNALAVGSNGSTNPTFQVDSSAATVATGIKINGAAASGGAGIAAISSITNESLSLNAKGAGVIQIGNISTGGIGLDTATTVVSNVSSAFTVGQNGVTNPAFKIDASAGTQATGVGITGFAAGGGVGLASISSATNENIAINAKGSGAILIGNVSTGNITLGKAITYGGVTLANSVTGTGSMVLSSAPSLTLTNATGLPLSTGVTGTLPASNLGLSQLTNSLGADVVLNNTATFFDGPSIAQGTTGTWFASGAVAVLDTTGASSFLCKLWDGTTVIASGVVTTAAASFAENLSLSGFLASPAANIRISCRDSSNTTGKILFNQSGLSKDATLSTFRIN